MRWFIGVVVAYLVTMITVFIFATTYLGTVEVPYSPLNLALVILVPQALAALINVSISLAQKGA